MLAHRKAKEEKLKISFSSFNINSFCDGIQENVLRRRRSRKLPGGATTGTRFATHARALKGREDCDGGLWLERLLASRQDAVR